MTDGLLVDIPAFWTSECLRKSLFDPTVVEVESIEHSEDSADNFPSCSSSAGNGDLRPQISEGAAQGQMIVC